MGLAFVLIFYAIALTVAASFAAVVLGTTAHLLTRRSGRKRKIAVLASVVFPFACVAYAGAWFAAYAVINDAFFHRDPGLGDSWATPLPNGYALLMIDTTGQGTVYNPKTQPIQGSVSSSYDAVFGVRQLQVSGNLIFGARDTGYFGRIGQGSNVVDSYFELNTKTGFHEEFTSLAALRQRAASEGVSLNLHKFYSVYLDYRMTWFDYSAGLILLLVPLIAFVALARWIWKIRQTARAGSGPLIHPHG